MDQDYYFQKNEMAGKGGPRIFYDLISKLLL